MKKTRFLLLPVFDSELTPPAGLQANRDRSSQTSLLTLRPASGQAVNCLLGSYNC